MPLQHPNELVDGERIAALMWRGRLNRQRLARAIGIDPSSLAQKLAGKRRWYLNDVVAAADALGTSVAYLTGETPDDRPLSDGVLVERSKWAAYQRWVETQPADRWSNGGVRDWSVGRMGLEPMTDGL